MKVVNREKSEYFKKYNPYFHTRAEYGRDADTIIFIYLKTPKGKASKYYCTLRFNSERSVSKENKLKNLEEYLLEVESSIFKAEFNKGYSIGEIILYSGEI